MMIRFRPIKRRNEDGQILIGVLAVVLAILVAVATLAVTLAARISSSDRTAYQSEAAGVALSGSNWFYSQLVADPNFYTDGEFAGSPAYNDQWVQVNPDGQLVSCRAQLSDCFQVKATPVGSIASNPNNPAGLPTDNEIDLNVTSRVDCRTLARLCQTEAYQSQLQRRNYLDFLYFTNVETLTPELYSQFDRTFQTDPGQTQYQWSPSCNSQSYAAGTVSANCLNPAYQTNANGGNSDNIGGPVFTNSANIYVCGNVSFTNGSVYPTRAVQATGNPPVDVLGGGCGAASNPSSYSTTTPPIPLPQPDALSTLQQIAGAYSGVGSMAVTGLGASGVNFQGSAVNAAMQQAVIANGGSAGGTPGTAGSYATIPPGDIPSGVVYVDGPASVSGTFSASITLVTAPGYNIITYSTYPTGGQLSPIPGNVKIGLIAGNDVVIANNDYPASGVTVNAAMLALGAPFNVNPSTGAVDNGQASNAPPNTAPGTPLVCPLPPSTSSGTATPQCGTVWAYNWATRLYGLYAPTLNITGAIVAQYRGSFGNYDTNPLSQNAGQLISGYQKTFNYDQRLLINQPPYFLQSSATQWIQAGTQQVVSNQQSQGNSA